MRSLTLGLLITTTFALTAHSQRMPDTQITYSLQGPVKAVRTEIAEVTQKAGRNVEGPRILLQTLFFNQDGNRTELGIYDAKGNVARRIVSKFEGWNCVEFLNYDGSGKMWLRGTNAFDDKGRITEKATYNGDGSLRSKTAITRDTQGRMTERVETDSKGDLLFKITNTFSAAGELFTSEIGYYDPPGKLRSMERRQIPEKRSEMLNYNPDGTLANKSVRGDREVNQYDPDGTLRKSTYSNEGGLLSQSVIVTPNGSIIKESKTPDELDAHGNWTKQTKLIADGAGTRTVKISYRLITYY